MTMGAGEEHLLNSLRGQLEGLLNNGAGRGRISEAACRLEVWGGAVRVREALLSGQNGF